jgi:predicted flap endonuclease-1-like 5' DNA nuclease
VATTETHSSVLPTVHKVSDLAQATHVGASNGPASATFQTLTAPSGTKDDLSLIRGIGSSLMKQLNDMGVYHFRQIAHWTEADAASVGVAVGFPGRVEREQWIEQARELQHQPVQTTAAE